MALEPITRKEKIIAGEDLQPITRLEKFLKQFGGCGGGSVPAAGGVTTLHINVTAANLETMVVTTFTADKTPLEMQEASVAGPIWCIVTFAAGVMSEKATSLGIPPAWDGINAVAFGSRTFLVHDQGGENDFAFAVSGMPGEEWIIELRAFAGN